MRGSTEPEKDKWPLAAKVDMNDKRDCSHELTAFLEAEIQGKQ